MGDNRLASIDSPDEIDVEHTEEVARRHLRRHPDAWHERAACIADQDIDPSKVGEHGFDHPVHLLSLSHIGDNTQRPTTQSAISSFTVGAEGASPYSAAARMSMLFTTTSAAMPARCRAYARPNPRAAPVAMATLPESLSWLVGALVPWVMVAPRQ